MLETFRKYSFLMIAVLVLVFVGLVFFGAGSSGLGIGGPVVLEAYGQKFDVNQRRKFEERHTRLITRLTMSATGNTQALNEYASILGRGSANDFVVNRLTLQKAMDDFGLQASKAEVETFIKDTLFWQDSGFNVVAYDDFVKNEMGALGATVKNLNDLVAEVICMSKLRDIISAGIEPSRELTKTDILSAQQRISYQLLSYPVTGFRDKPMPTDEEIKAKWDENNAVWKEIVQLTDEIKNLKAEIEEAENKKGVDKDTEEKRQAQKAKEGQVATDRARVKYLSKPKRKVTYVLASPDYEAIVKSKEESVEKPSAVEPEDTTSPTEEEGCQEPAEQPAEAPAVIQPPSQPTPIPAKSAKDQLSEAERKDALFNLAVKFGELDEKMLDQKSLSEAAADLGLTVKTTELVEKDMLPADFSSNFRDTPGTAADAIFDAPAGTKKFEPLGDDQWLYFEVLETEEPVALSFEEAKEDVRKDLVSEQAIELMREKAEGHHELISIAMKDGKTFAEATNELELKPVVRSEVTRSGTMGGVMREYTIAARVNPGELSDLITDTEEDERFGLARSFFLLVEKREVYEETGIDAMVDMQVEGRLRGYQNAALMNWFMQAKASANFSAAATE